MSVNSSWKFAYGESFGTRIYLFITVISEPVTTVDGSAESTVTADMSPLIKGSRKNPEKLAA